MTSPNNNQLSRYHADESAVSIAGQAPNEVAQIQQIMNSAQARIDNVSERVGGMENEMKGVRFNVQTTFERVGNVEDEMRGLCSKA